MLIRGLNCPNCGAPLSIPEGKNKCFCSNCGTPVLIDDGQIYVNINKTEKREIIERKEIIDKAKIAAAEERSESLAIVGAVIMGILMIVLIGILVLHEEPDIIRKLFEILHLTEG